MGGQIARLVTAIMNKRRQDEGLGLAEEKAQPDEEAHLDGIITTFTPRSSGSGTPATSSEQEHQEQAGIVRAELTVRDNLPGEHAARNLRRAPQLSRPRFAFPGPARM